MNYPPLILSCVGSVVQSTPVHIASVSKLVTKLFPQEGPDWMFYEDWVLLKVSI